MGSDETHWNEVYEGRDEAEVSWFESAPERLAARVAAHAAPGDPIIDVGAGRSRLVDLLIARGLGPVTLLDLSKAAVAQARARLGEDVPGVRFVTADVTGWSPDRGDYAVWHDRAAFHFLVEAADRAAYIDTMQKALRDGGTAILSTFADDGPDRCSGLPVQRYAPEDLAAELDALAPRRFRLLATARLTHVTPAGAEQRSQTSVFRHTA
ncbi:trans-aconitate 2-methyltransferase [Rhodosalinus sp. FB01]|uniref:class I SAM-dependent methyltransferase n=1 Tax=Rhodosalinus sp. FB01 TaxID=3239194 RepID=UPI0035255B10